MTEAIADIDRVLVSRTRIARRVGELGKRIAEVYAGRELTIVAVLTGSLIFLADLVRKLPLRMKLELVSVSSYVGASTQSAGARIQMPLRDGLEGKDVLVVDDILDSGQTLELLLEQVRSQKPASVRSCVLLRKRRAELSSRLEPDFYGFDVSGEFVVGYGLDYDNRYRNLPDICALGPHVFEPDTALGERA